MTSGTILIYGGTIKQREQQVFNIIKEVNPRLVEKENPDLLIIKKEKDKGSLGIQKSRSVISFFATKPYSSKSKIVVIYNAQDLTTQAQNALLKTLEEPPSYALIILCAKTENSLLPTILSRCRKIHIAGEAENKPAGLDTTQLNLFELQNSNVETRMEQAQELAKLEKEDLVELLENFLQQLRTKLLEEPNMDTVDHLKRVMSIKKDIEETNVNIRLALENIFLNL